jgi:uncharacterized membrane protein
MDTLAICLLGLIGSLTPQSERFVSDTSRDRLGVESPNAGICYAWGILFPLVYLLTRRRNRQDTSLRFHCIQCLILFLLMALCLPFHKGWWENISAVAFPVFAVAYFVVLYKAVSHKRFRLPLISAFAEKLT